MPVRSVRAVTVYVSVAELTLESAADAATRLTVRHTGFLSAEERVVGHRHAMLGRRRHVDAVIADGADLDVTERRQRHDVPRPRDAERQDVVAARPSKLALLR